ncbi:MAG: hypothetical protein KME60_12285 [Cyanomargarita calcarea GSE-NOS-MK-12-04C]|jgi:hypothetical protein|uniref:Uncharacterized protein n=1 Tax=Cyanomargarita calcarea GSE-NOS-MK-12-04C TaxID=2839659 RepID=A0A951QNE4_9CYAN|nr:hypothetical protein [Cyanomargarita calcarea GSE-NOS-MK-12-04C]
MPQPNDKATSAEIYQWAELDELEKYACTGPQSTNNQFADRVQSLMDGTYLQKYLEKVQAEKQKVSEKMSFLSAVEAILIEKISQQNNNY